MQSISPAKYLHAAAIIRRNKNVILSEPQASRRIRSPKEIYGFFDFASLRSE
jgi:hypothetical protein